MLGYASLHMTTAGETAILLATSPILTSGWLAIYHRDHLDVRQWGGLLVGLLASAALRLHEAGMVKSAPQKIIAQGTDWRFLNELKKELKA